MRLSKGLLAKYELVYRQLRSALPKNDFSVIDELRKQIYKKYEEQNKVENPVVESDPMVRQALEVFG